MLAISVFENPLLSDVGSFSQLVFCIYHFHLQVPVKKGTLPRQRCTAREQVTKTKMANIFWAHLSRGYFMLNIKVIHYVKSVLTCISSHQ